MHKQYLLLLTPVMTIITTKIAEAAAALVPFVSLHVSAVFHLPCPPTPRHTDLVVAHGSSRTEVQRACYFFRLIDPSVITTT